MSAVAHTSKMPAVTAGAGVMVLAMSVPVVSQPTTLLQVVVVVAPTIVSVLQELNVLVVHSSLLGLLLLGSLESVKSTETIV